MLNRENLRHGDLKFRLEKEIEEKLRHHAELAATSAAWASSERRKNRFSLDSDMGNHKGRGWLIPG
jgi:hypothetical protein